MKFFLFLTLITSISCSTSTDIKRDVEGPYRGAGVEQYFLPELPEWANFSQVGECVKSKSIRYLDFLKLSNSFSLTYFENVQLQLSFNNSIERHIKNNEKKALYLNDEMFLFSDAFEKINGKAYDFQVPTFNRLHLIWIDLIYKDDKMISRLKKFMHSKIMEEGFPIFISSCLSAEDIQIFIEKNFKNFGSIRKISAEYFSIFSGQDQKKVGLAFNIKRFFKGKKVYLFAPRSFPPIDIYGYDEFGKF